MREFRAARTLPCVGVGIAAEVRMFALFVAITALVMAVPFLLLGIVLGRRRRPALVVQPRLIRRVVEDPLPTGPYLVIAPEEGWARVVQVLRELGLRGDASVLEPPARRGEPEAAMFLGETVTIGYAFDPVSRFRQLQLEPPDEELKERIADRLVWTRAGEVLDLLASPKTEEVRRGQQVARAYGLTRRTKRPQDSDRLVAS